MTFTKADLAFLRACGIAADGENFSLEALWLNWQRANIHRDFSHCIGCGAATYEPHALDCKHGALMVFGAERTVKHQPPVPDGTERLLKKFGIPATRENYLRLAFGGNPPQELDGEVEAELPEKFQSPTAADSGEPSYTTPSGFPLCSICGRSTRNMDTLMCAPCRNRTCLSLTAADRKWLRDIKVLPI